MKRIIVAFLCVFCFSGLAFAEVWKDDFEAGEISKNWAQVSMNISNLPDWKIESGVLKGNWPFWNAQMLFLKEYPSLNYTIRVKCRIDKVWQAPELASAGIMFRAYGTDKESKDIHQFYGFGIGDSSARFGFIYGTGNWHILETNPRKHDIGKWYELKVVVKDYGVSCYVDDELICKLHGAHFEGKFVGLTMGSNISASFDDFMITDQAD